MDTPREQLSPPNTSNETVTRRHRARRFPSAYVEIIKGRGEWKPLWHARPSRATDASAKIEETKWNL